LKAISPAAFTVAVEDLTEIEATAWDACANPGIAPAGTDESYNPFVSHAFLSAMEESGCVGGRTGWAPAPVTVRRADGTLVAAAPAYLKSHSMGEYVFDGGWADAYERAGGHYYPKVQVSVPFTPVTGPRLLVGPSSDADVARTTLLASLEALRGQTGASSTHLTFLPEQDAQDLAERGYLLRTDQQFHWIDEGYGDFEGFLGALASRKRKTIRRERRDALAEDIEVEWVTGRDITEAHWDAFFAFYMDTGSRKWGRPYLNRQFFAIIGEQMAERILLIMAKRAGRHIAGAINMIGDVALYGRNWGCVEDHPFLHFEICYYQAIEFALARGLKRVEAGAQGEHKLARGYRPVTTYSAHHIADPGLKRAVADYLRRERQYVAAAQDEYAGATPFRRDEQE
jgi:uncharacterized protein